MNKKIERTFVCHEAYDILCQEIIEGSLPPGMQLRDKDLAERLGVSRTPIREALLRLKEEGFVQTKPNRATFVSPIDFHNAQHLYSIVWTLESLAMSQAFKFITPLHIEKMNEANETFFGKLTQSDRLAALESDYDFHSVYIKLSENIELEKILSEIKQKLKRIDLYYYEKIHNAADSYEEHLQIIEALKKNDLNLALNAVETNWKGSFSRFNF